MAGPVATAATEPVKVLLVEDDEDDYLITRDMLARQEGVRFTVEWRPDYAGALAAIREQRHDVYLVDYRLGARTGLELVSEGFAARPFAPVIMLTGQADVRDRSRGDRARASPTTWSSRSSTRRAWSARSATRSATSRRSRDLSRSEERYALAVRAANDGIWDWDLEQNRIYFSPRWHAILGQPEQAADEDPSAWFELVHSGDVLPAARRDRGSSGRPHPASAVRAPDAPRRRHLALGDDPRPGDPRRRRPPDADGRLAVGRHRPPDRPAAPAARRAARHAHRPAQPDPVRRSPQPDPAAPAARPGNRLRGPVPRHRPLQAGQRQPQPRASATTC